jgi:PAS domain-containing protein
VTTAHDVLGRLSNHETVRNYEARLRGKDGSIKHVLIDSNVLWDGDRFVHSRSCTRDVTDRKQAEEALEIRARQQAAVAELGQRALGGRFIQGHGGAIVLKNSTGPGATFRVELPIERRRSS